MAALAFACPHYMNQRLGQLPVTHGPAACQNTNSTARLYLLQTQELRPLKPPGGPQLTHLGESGSQGTRCAVTREAFPKPPSSGRRTLFLQPQPPSCCFHLHTPSRAGLLAAPASPRPRYCQAAVVWRRPSPVPRDACSLPHAVGLSYRVPQPREPSPYSPEGTFVERSVSEAQVAPDRSSPSAGDNGHASLKRNKYIYNDLV